MAGDWIKVECVTPDKPEVHAIAERLQIEPDSVFGKLFRVWAWADQHTISGNAEGNAASVTKSVIDRIAGVTGFADAMMSVGWLMHSGQSMSFPNFDRHNGETAKKRGLTAKRVAAHKKRGNASANAEGNAHSVTSALPREEKNKSKSSPPTPSGETQWQAVAAEISDLGVEDLGSLRQATNEGLSLGELRAIVQHFREHRGTNGWGPEALHYRLRNAFPGQQTERGWPKPDAKARSHLESLERSRQREQEASTQAAKLDRSETAYADLESRHGPVLSAMDLDGQLRLASEISTQLVCQIRRSRGANTKSTRRPLLLLLQSKAA